MALPAATSAASSFGVRVLGSLRLDPSTYAEVATDRRAIWQSFAIVAASALASASQIMLSRVPQLSDDILRLGGALPAVALIAAVVTPAVVVIAWMLVILHAGLLSVVFTERIFGPEVRTVFGRLLRALGFASAPSLFRILEAAPSVGGLVGIAVSAWTILATVMAIRQALDTTLGEALKIIIVAWLVVIVIVVLALVVFRSMGGW